MTWGVKHSGTALLAVIHFSFWYGLDFLGGSEPCVAFLGSSAKQVTDPSDLCPVL